MCGRKFSPSESGDVFACSSATRGDMVKQRPLMDSVRQVDLKSILHDVLIVGGDAGQGGEKTFGASPPPTTPTPHTSLTPCTPTQHNPSSTYSNSTYSNSMYLFHSTLLTCTPTLPSSTYCIAPSPQFPLCSVQHQRSVAPKVCINA